LVVNVHDLRSEYVGSNQLLVQWLDLFFILVFLLWIANLSDASDYMLKLEVHLLQLIDGDVIPAQAHVAVHVDDRCNPVDVVLEAPVGGNVLLGQLEKVKHYATRIHGIFDHTTRLPDVSQEWVVFQELLIGF